MLGLNLNKNFYINMFVRSSQHGTLKYVVQNGASLETKVCFLDHLILGQTTLEVACLESEYA